MLYYYITRYFRVQGKKPNAQDFFCWLEEVFFFKKRDTSVIFFSLRFAIILFIIRLIIVTKSPGLLQHIFFKNYFHEFLFFTACSDELFNRLARSSASKRILTLKEINMSFLPFERQVFLLRFLKKLFTTNKNSCLQIILY